MKTPVVHWSYQGSVGLCFDKGLLTTNQVKWTSPGFFLRKWKRRENREKAPNAEKADDTLRGLPRINLPFFPVRPATFRLSGPLRPPVLAHCHGFQGSDYPAARTLQSQSIFQIFLPPRNCHIWKIRPVIVPRLLTRRMHYKRNLRRQSECCKKHRTQVTVFFSPAREVDLISPSMSHIDQAPRKDSQCVTWIFSGPVHIRETTGPAGIKGVEVGPYGSSQDVASGIEPPESGGGGLTTQLLQSFPQAHISLGTLWPDPALLQQISTQTSGSLGPLPLPLPLQYFAFSGVGQLT